MSTHYLLSPTKGVKMMTDKKPKKKPTQKTPLRKRTPRKKPNKVDTHKKELIAALEQSLGIVTTACTAVKISRPIYYKYYNTDPVFKKSVDSIGEMALDTAESKLHQLIKEGNPTAIIFYLKTKGKKRGYVERQEIEARVSSYNQGEWDGEETPEAYLQRTLSQTTK